MTVLGRGARPADGLRASVTRLTASPRGATTTVCISRASGGDLKVCSSSVPTSPIRCHVAPVASSVGQDRHSGAFPLRHLQIIPTRMLDNQSGGVHPTNKSCRRGWCRQPRRRDQRRLVREGAAMQARSVSVGARVAVAATPGFN